MSKLVGEIELKGDKSISHRALIFAVLANGTSSIKNLSSSVDIKNTIDCLISCGANNLMRICSCAKHDKYTQQSWKTNVGRHTICFVVLFVLKNFQSKMI